GARSRLSGGRPSALDAPLPTRRATPCWAQNNSASMFYREARLRHPEYSPIRIIAAPMTTPSVFFQPKPGYAPRPKRLANAEMRTRRTPTPITVQANAGLFMVISPLIDSIPARPQPDARTSSGGAPPGRGASRAGGRRESHADGTGASPGYTGGREQSPI